jgi:hypothetical protein
LKIRFRGFTSSNAKFSSANAAPIMIDEQFAIFFMERPGRETIE